METIILVSQSLLTILVVVVLVRITHAANLYIHIHKHDIPVGSYLWWNPETLEFQKVHKAQLTKEDSYIYQAEKSRYYLHTPPYQTGKFIGTLGDANTYFLEQKNK